MSKAPKLRFKEFSGDWEYKKLEDISTQIKRTSDYVIDNKNGFMFKPEDEIDLKNRILDYYKLNNEQKRKIYKKARETAIKYDSKNTSNKLIEVFK